MADSASDIDAVAAELLRLPPEEFTAARNERAAAASGAVATGIKALRKPVVAAWAVNLLVADGQLAEAVELGAALREAQDDLDAGELTALGRQRRQLVASLARRAAELAQEAGTALSPAARDAVAVTVNAAVMDERAAAAVLTGRLRKPLEAGGVDGVDLGDFVAGSPPTGSTARPSRTTDDLAERRARKAAEQAARAAERAASEAERALARIDALLAKARDRGDLLHERREELRAQLERVEGEAREAAAETARLEDERGAAASASASAAREAQRSRAAVPD